MASFRIQVDTENNTNLLRGKGREHGNNQKRAVLGLIDGNREISRSGKNSLPIEKSLKGLQPKKTDKQENVKKNGNVPDQPKQQAFKVFEEDSKVPLKVPAVKNETKARVLRDRKTEPVLKPSTSVDAFIPDCIAAIHRASPVALPEPMSPDESLDGSMSMDISLKSDSKVSKECEAALKDLDHLNLTERLYLCEEYRDEISVYLRSLQLTQRARPHYMSKQPDITHNMRAVLVDWLVEVVEEYKLTNETLYLTVSYIDRFLSSMSVVRAKLQLVGTAAMFIAAKYEEIYPPDVKDFVYITDDTYTKSQVLRMEHLILRILRFELATPTILNFLTDYTSHYPTPDNVKYLAMYLGELSLLEGDPYLQFLPSEIAAAALCVARATLLPDEDILPPALQKVLDLDLADIVHVINAIERTYRNAEKNPQQATRDKYRTEKYLKVASITRDSCSTR